MVNIRPTQAEIVARKREIAQRYARKNYRSKPHTFSAVRAAELTRLYTYRYGQALPDNDAGVLAMRVMLDHLGQLNDAPRRISRWLDRWAPWLTERSHERAITDAVQRPLRYRADKIAWKLRVTSAERQALNLRTIGAIDLPRDERLDQAKQRRRARDEARRRAQGAVPREQYEARSAARTKPWETIGMSRRAWYRAGKPTTLAQVRTPHISNSA